MIDVSVIIVAWNRCDLLYTCLKSVFEQTKDVNFEVIYIDNASQDKNVDMVEREFDKVQIIKNERNEGFIKANNQGINVAKGRYVLLLNSDTIVLDNAIANIVKFADKHPDAAVVGCKVLNPDRTLQRTCFMYPSALNMLIATTYLYKIFPKSKFFGREYMTWWDCNGARNVETVAGCFSLVKREAIAQVGLMDERYYMYGDDPDWCYRFSKKGWKILYASDIQIIHYGGQSSKQMAREFRWQMEGSKMIFIQLHRTYLELLIYRFLLVLFFWGRWPYWFVRGILGRKNRQSSFDTAMTYLIGGFYCIIDWRKLLININVISEITAKSSTYT